MEIRNAQGELIAEHNKREDRQRPVMSEAQASRKIAAGYRPARGGGAGNPRHNKNWQTPANRRKASRASGGKKAGR